ncbi:MULTISPECIES: nodulation protein NfeD [unclassified Legionella]|uniref:NfeD family protein n=1 Tax=unclassified Legionella TaxID=2622702 RepID=UPI001F5F9018|nr:MULTISPECIES: nodulation protein NfeD [unclassified Legionella]MDI9819897.1 nodulation protein NfeD [Legionella sp. PL877]
MEMLPTTIPLPYFKFFAKKNSPATNSLAISLWKYLLALFFLTFILLPAASANKITEIKVNGAIGPATADFISRGIAKGQDSSLVLIILNTPGGLYQSTRLIVQDILASKVPIVTYVYPDGSRAASAGTFLVYASTIAAMAPSTHLGAASPVSITGAMDKEDKNNQAKSSMDKKVLNDAIAYIRTLAELRGRNAEFAEKAVTDAATLTANEALKAGVINLIAKDRDDLLSQLDGLTVTQYGQKIQLDTKNATVETLTPDWRMRFLQVITEPTVAYLLLLLGIYGIFFELVNPGFLLPGVVGAISILIALYALQLLPISYAGLSLIILGIAFIIAEAFAPSFGALGLGGTIAFVIGSILLIDTEYASYQIAWSAIWAMAAFNFLILFTLVTFILRSRKREPQHGVNVLIGAEGRSLSLIDPQGQAVIRGEIWNVHAQQPIVADKRIKVIAAKGLQLEVEEISSPNGEKDNYKKN